MKSIFYTGNTCEVNVYSQSEVEEKFRGIFPGVAVPASHRFWDKELLFKVAFLALWSGSLDIVLTDNSKFERDFSCGVIHAPVNTSSQDYHSLFVKMQIYKDLIPQAWLHWVSMEYRGRPVEEFTLRLDSAIRTLIPYIKNDMYNS